MFVHDFNGLGVFGRALISNIKEALAVRSKKSSYQKLKNRAKIQLVNILIQNERSKMDTLKGSIATIVGSVAFGIIMLTQFPSYLLTKTSIPGIGYPVTVASNYEKWQQQKQLTIENNTIRTPLKVLSDNLNDGQGVKGVTFSNLPEKKLNVDITGFDAKNTY